jgi:hypothetical protein
MKTDPTTCTRSTVARWHQPDPLGVWGGPANPPDPGPWMPGETVECPGCGATVAVTHRITNDRSTGTQYVGSLAEH